MPSNRATQAVMAAVAVIVATTLIMSAFTRPLVW